MKMRFPSCFKISDLRHCQIIRSGATHPCAARNLRFNQRFLIDGNVILVANVGFLVLPGPAGLSVLLRLYSLSCAESQGIGFKTLRGLARLDLCVFLLAVALPGHIHKARINALTLLGATALRDPLLIKALEQGFMAFMPGQLRSKQLDDPGIRDLVL